MSISPIVIEIVGPAGAGKTTLARALAKSSTAIQLGCPLRRLSLMPLYLGSAVSSLPAMLSRPEQSRRFTRRELTLIVYLQLQLWALKRYTLHQHNVLLLDQGPVYKLARICNFELENRKGAGFKGWWDKMVRQWAATLALIVQVDAANEVLLERVRTRDTWHLAKHVSEPAAYTLLARQRTAIHGICSEIVGSNGPTPLYFRTDEEELDHIVQQILARFDSEVDYASPSPHYG
jgi:shikimate kinase